MENIDYDLYEVLGITEDERKLKGKDFEKVLKKKYKAKALEFHPDRNVGKSESEIKEAEEMFKRVNLANSVLSDQKKRDEYDNGGTSESLFSKMRDMMKNFMGGFSGFETEDSCEGYSTVSLTMDDMMNPGKYKKIGYSAYTKCPKCGGYGGSVKPCRECGGSGMKTVRATYNQIVQTTCQHCGGSGFVVTNKCDKCGGNGREESQGEFELKIPYGVRGGMVMLYNIDNGMKIQVRFVYDETVKESGFEIKGDDVYSELWITLPEAILGTSKKVGLPDGGSIEVKVKGGVGNKDIYRLPSKGLTDKYGNRGNFYCVVRYSIPSQLSDKERDIVTELSKMEHFKRIEK